MVNLEFMGYDRDWCDSPSDHLSLRKVMDRVETPTISGASLLPGGIDRREAS